MSKVWVLQHTRCETLGTISHALEDAALAWQYIKVFEGNPVPPEIGRAGGLIVMGGPQSAYEQDQFPYLRDEIRFIRQALDRDLPVLGVCLGSQLLATALGGRVTKAPAKEIGWFPLTLKAAAAEDRLLSGLPTRFQALHWHGDIFEVPAGATSLARSEPTPHQAFRYGDKAWGFLFHLEMDEQMIRDLTVNFADEVAEAKADPAQILSETAQYTADAQRLGATVFNRWAELVQRV